MGAAASVLAYNRSSDGIERCLRPANGRSLVLVVEDVNMAQRERGDQSACEEPKLITD